MLLFQLVNSVQVGNAGPGTALSNALWHSSDTTDQVLIAVPFMNSIYCAYRVLNSSQQDGL